MSEMTKIAVESIDAVRRRLAVEVPAAEVTAEVERAFVRLQRQARVPGFRPGKAPRSVLERMFGEQVRADVFTQLIQSSFVHALQEQQLDPVGQPQILTENAQVGGPLCYFATIEVRPEVKISGYGGLEVERPLRRVTDGDVGGYLESLRESFAQLRIIEDRTAARPGDIATFDYEVRVAGRVARRADGRLVEVKERGKGDDLAARLDGEAVGNSLEYDVEYPPDHPDKELAAKKVSFSVRLKSIATKVLPALDDEFAKDHGDCETLDQLRERIRKYLEGISMRDADRAARDALVAQIVRSHPLEVPTAMVDRRLDSMVDEVLEGLGPSRPPASREQDLRARLRTELEPRARDQVRAALLLDAIARQERIVVEESALDEEIRRLIESVPPAARERWEALEHEPAYRDSLRSQMLRDRALEFVFSQARVRDVEPPASVADVG